MGQEAISRLQTWYHAQCDGKWEHTYGIRIENCDNPGWLLQVDLAGTALANRPFQTIGSPCEPEGEDWLFCTTDVDQEGAPIFRAAGGPFKLGEMIETFLCWADA